MSPASSRYLCHASWQARARGLNASSYGDDSVTSLGKLLWLSLQFPLVLIYMLFFLPQLSSIRFLLLLLQLSLLLLINYLRVSRKV